MCDRPESMATTVPKIRRSVPGDRLRAYLALAGTLAQLRAAEANGTFAYSDFTAVAFRRESLSPEQAKNAAERTDKYFQRPRQNYPAVDRVALAAARMSERTDVRLRHTT